jgi:hypothetical protein
MIPLHFVFLAKYYYGDYSLCHYRYISQNQDVLHTYGYMGNANVLVIKH